MGQTVSPRPLLLSLRWRITITAALACHLTCILLLAGSLYALDPNKHMTQYIHTSWRIQDGSLPAGMFSITQTSDGFLWFSALEQGVYRFDGARFLPWVPPAKIGSLHIDGVFADRAGGLWATGDHEIAHVKDGAVIAYFELEGIGGILASAEIPTGRCGSREPPTGFKTRQFAISLTARRSVSESPMECRSPRPIPC